MSEPEAASQVREPTSNSREDDSPTVDMTGDDKSLQAKDSTRNDSSTLVKITAYLAAGGALWFGIMSLVTAWVYDPVGVHPRDVGLTSTEILTQSAAGLIALLLVVLVLSALVFGVWAFWSKDMRTQRAELEPEPVLHMQVTLVQAGCIAPLALLAGVIAVVLVLAFVASSARDDLKDGKRPSLIWGLFPSPWRGEVVTLHRVGRSDLRLPECALYLGQADSTVVLRVVQPEDDGSRHSITLRIPSSSVELELTRDLRKCPQ